MGRRPSTTSTSSRNASEGDTPKANHRGPADSVRSNRSQTSPLAVGGPSRRTPRSGQRHRRRRRVRPPGGASIVRRSRGRPRALPAKVRRQGGLSAQLTHPCRRPVELASRPGPGRRRGRFSSGPRPTDYLLPAAAELPIVEYGHIETPLTPTRAATRARAIEMNLDVDGPCGQ
jgi:hypothetical protein